MVSATNLSESNWSEVAGQTAVPGTGGLDAFSDTNVGVSVPE